MSWSFLVTLAQGYTKGGRGNMESCFCLVKAHKFNFTINAYHILRLKIISLVIQAPNSQDIVLLKTSKSLNLWGGLAGQGSAKSQQLWLLY